MKRILILNGSGRKNGSTAAMTRAFALEAEKNGGEVKEFFVQFMDIKGCLNCGTCGKKERPIERPCVQHDGMDEIYPAFAAADIVAFASPVYFWDITGTLKTAIDRTYASFRNSGIAANKKEFALLLTSGGSPMDHMREWSGEFERQLGWTFIGAAINSSEEAARIGASIG